MRAVTIALVAAATLLGAPAAHASEASRIIERCTHGQPLSGFSEKGYREALKQMPTEVSEYSDCASLIRKAELSSAGGAGTGELGGAASNVALPLTPTEQREVLSAHRYGATPLLIGHTRVKPGVVHAGIASAASALPTSLLGVLALLLGCALLLAIGETLERVRARRHG